MLPVNIEYHLYLLDEFLLQNLTGGGFEGNLQSLKLTEGVDFFHFN